MGSHEEPSRCKGRRRPLLEVTQDEIWDSAKHAHLEAAGRALGEAAAALGVALMAAKRTPMIETPGLPEDRAHCPGYQEELVGPVARAVLAAGDLLVGLERGERIYRAVLAGSLTRDARSAPDRTSGAL